jgi:hypothetical protein
MGEIPRQLAADFAPDSILLNAKVVSLDRQTVRLADGETHSARAIVLAVDRASSAGLFPTIADPYPWKSNATTLGHRKGNQVCQFFISTALGMDPSTISRSFPTSRRSMHLQAAAWFPRRCWVAGMSQFPQFKRS